MRAHSDGVENSLAKGQPCTATPRVMRTMIYTTRSSCTIPAVAIPMTSKSVTAANILYRGFERARPACFTEGYESSCLVVLCDEHKVRSHTFEAECGAQYHEGQLENQVV